MTDNVPVPDATATATRLLSDLIEQLADAEHASWARWMAYLFSKCESRQKDSTLLIPAALVEHWRRQVDTPYADLSEREKQSDRDEVAHILPFIQAAMAAQQAQVAELSEQLQAASAERDRLAAACEEMRDLLRSTMQGYTVGGFIRDPQRIEAILAQPADARGSEIMTAVRAVIAAFDANISPDWWLAMKRSVEQLRALVGPAGDAPSETPQERCK